MVKRRIKNKLVYAFLVLLLFTAILVSGWNISPAYAYSVNDASVLTDLQKDSGFNANDYPDDANDYSIKIIQVAESTDGELLIYTYQPCQKTKYLIATKINMSLTDRMGDETSYYDLTLGEKDRPKLYDLMLISCEGVFCKYVVCDFNVSSNIVRYYNISSIYRDCIDEDNVDTGSSNKLENVACRVGQLWTAVTSNGLVSYSRTDTYLVEIKPDQMYIGKLRYYDGLKLGIFENDEDYCDSWYIAFDCDYKIDDLYEADVSYSSRTYKTKYLFGKKNSTEYGEWQTGIETTLRKDRIVKNELFGFSGRQHEWKEVESVDYFKANEDLTVDAQNRLNDKQWVLRFAVTNFLEEGRKTALGDAISWTESGSEIADVTILRLYFEMDGKFYNLGVVNSQQTPDPDAPPDNNPDTPDFGFGKDGFDFWAWLAKLLHTDEKTLKMIAAIIITVLAVVVVVAVISALSPVFAPFKIVGKLFKKRKRNKKAR